MHEVSKSEFDRRFAKGVSLYKAGAKKGNMMKKPKIAPGPDKGRYERIVEQLRVADEQDLYEDPGGFGATVTDGKKQKGVDAALRPPPDDVMSKMRTWKHDPNRFIPDQYLMERGLDEPCLPSKDEEEQTTTLPRDRRGIGSSGKSAAERKEEKLVEEHLRKEAEERTPPQARKGKGKKQSETPEERRERAWRRQSKFATPFEGATHAWCAGCSQKGKGLQKWTLPDPKNFVCPMCKGDVEFYTEEGCDRQWKDGGINTLQGWFTMATWKTGNYGGAPSEESSAPKRHQQHPGWRGTGSRKAEGTAWPNWGQAREADQGQEDLMRSNPNSWWAAPSSSSSSRWHERR